MQNGKLIQILSISVRCKVCSVSCALNEVTKDGFSHALENEGWEEIQGWWHCRNCVDKAKRDSENIFCEHYAVFQLRRKYESLLKKAKKYLEWSLVEDGGAMRVSQEEANSIRSLREYTKKLEKDLQDAIAEVEGD